jgi:hypothetical protein
MFFLKNRLNVVSLVMVILFFLPLQAHGDLGLKERQAVETFKQEKYPQLTAAINEAAGFDIEIEIDWDSIAAGGVRAQSFDQWQKVFFDPIVLAFKAVNVDDITAGALKKNLKKINIISTGKKHLSPSYPPTYSDGTITIDDRLVNVSSVKTRAKIIQSTLEKMIGARPHISPHKATLDSLYTLQYEEIRRILRRLHWLRSQMAKNKSIKMPWISVYLHTGHEFVGKITNFREDRHGNSGILLYSQKKMNLTYIPVKSIQAVTINTPGLNDKEQVEATSELIRALSFGKIKCSPAKIPGRLVVKRKVHALGETLSQKVGSDLHVSVAWDDLPDTDETSASINLLLDDIDAVLNQFLSDEALRQTLKNKIGSIAIKVAQKPGGSLEGNMLEIYVVLDEKDVTCLNRKGIQDLINRNL